MYVNWPTRHYRLKCYKNVMLQRVGTYREELEFSHSDSKGSRNVDLGQCSTWCGFPRGFSQVNSTHPKVQTPHVTSRNQTYAKEII